MLRWYPLVWPEITQESKTFHAREPILKEKKDSKFKEGSREFKVEFRGTPHFHVSFLLKL